MATFVLVHGAWHGGWCWIKVAEPLRTQGHRVFAPTLTGLGERAHLVSPDINLDTHIQDIVGVLESEELMDVILVGHSYAGMVITGVAERVTDRLSALVYVDAFVPENGQSMLSINPERVRGFLDRAAAGDANLIPTMKAENWGVRSAADIAWLDRHLTPQPAGTYTQPVSYTDLFQRIENLTYILASGNENGVFSPVAEKLRRDPAWRCETVPCGHEVMVDEPERLVEILLDVAGAS